MEENSPRVRPPAAAMSSRSSSMCGWGVPGRRRVVRLGGRRRRGRERRGRAGRGRRQGRARCWQAPLPGQRLERAADRQRGRGQRHRPPAEQPLGQQPAHRERRHPQRRRAARVRIRRDVQPHHVGPRRDIRAERAEHPVRRVVQLVERGKRSPPRGELLRFIVGVPGAGTDLAGARSGRVPGRGERGGEVVGQHVDAPGGRVGQDQREPLPRGRQLARGVVGDLAAGPPRRGVHGGRRQLGRRDRGHPVDQVVRLVDDHHVVLGEDVAVLQRVDGQQRVVGDDDVRPARDLACPLGKAAAAEAAPLCPDALPGRDRDLPPCPLVDARHQLVAVAGLRGLGPLPQPRHLPPDLGGRARLEEGFLRVVGGAAAQPVLAQVVAPPLEDREGRRPAEQRLQRFREARQVAVDELALQRDRGGGHHDRRVHRGRVPGRGHQVRQRLPRARARLDREVLAAVHGAGDRLGHRDLPRALGPGDPFNGSGQQGGDSGKFAGVAWHV
jgi:hypothetical protein